MVFLSLITAIKYQEDDIHTNTYYARVGGVKSDDLFNLELEFLSLIDFNLYVDERLFISSVERIQTAFEMNKSNECINI